MLAEIGHHVLTWWTEVMIEVADQPPAEAGALPEHLTGVLKRSAMNTPPPSRYTHLITCPWNTLTSTNTQEGGLERASSTTVPAHSLVVLQGTEKACDHAGALVVRVLWGCDGPDRCA